MDAGQSQRENAGRRTDGFVMTRPIAPDPTIGVWKLNREKSSFTPGPELKSSVMRIEPWEDGLRMVHDTVFALGNQLHVESAYRLDGRDYGVDGSPIADTVSARRISDGTVEMVWRKQGNVTIAARILVSPDGRTLRVISTGSGVLGRMADDYLVYERQSMT
jgi:hypothetical protein